jgi:hypothetical protein
MSDRTTSVPTPESQSPSLTPESLCSAIAGAVPWFGTATAEEQGRVLADAAEVLGSGLELGEYLEGLADFDTAAAYLAECGPVTGPMPEPAASVPGGEKTGADFTAAPTPQVPVEEPTEEQLAAAKLEARRLLTAAVREYVKGERGLTKHRLEAGRLAAEYVWHRVSVQRHDRAAAVKTIAGRLMEESGVDVEVNALIATYQAAQLLGGDGVDVSGASYTALEAFRPLVQRQDGTEAWAIVRGVEEKAQALFREAVVREKGKEAMPVRTVEQRVKELDAEAKHVRAAELAKAAADPKAGKKAKDQAAKAQAQADKAQAAVDKAKASPTESSPAAVADPTATATPAGKPEECRAPVAHLASIAAAGTAKDVAAMVVELVTGSDEPDDVLREQLQALRDHPEMSRLAKRVIQHALVYWSQQERSISPVQAAAALAPNAPSSNGHPVAAH